MDKAGIERRARLLFAITLLVIALAGGAWYLFSVSGHTRYRLLTRDSVSGLTEDSPVEFHGVQVGTVRSVELMGPALVRILIRVSSDTPISTATRATITSRGLSPKGFTGYVYVALEDTAIDARPLVAAPGEEYPVIPTVPARDISLDLEISKVNALVQTFLDPGTLSSLKQAVASVQEITETLAENNAKLGSLIENTERASTRFAPLLDSSNRSLEALQTQILPEAYRALDQLETLSDSLNGAVTEIVRDPSLLLRGRGEAKPGPGE